LGSGASELVPCHQCHCAFCEEANRLPHLRRRHSAYLLNCENEFAVLLDYGSECLWEYKLDYLNIAAIFISHLHSDHTAGLFSLRWSKGPGIPIYYPRPRPHDNIVDFASFIDQPFNMVLRELDDMEKVPINNLEVTALPLNHSIGTMGYFIEHEDFSIAYLLDTKGLPNSTEKFLQSKKISLALVDACFGPDREDFFHNNTMEAIEILEQIKPELGILTHFSHNGPPVEELSDVVRSRESLLLAIDGMTIEGLDDPSKALHATFPQ